MAFTASYWKLVMSFRDRDHNPSHMTVYLDTALTFVNLVDESMVGNLVAAVAALSNAVLDRYSLSQEWTDSALLASTPVEESDVERKGVFGFRAANRAPVVCRVPSIKNTLVEDGSNVIPNTGVVTTFINAMTTNAIFTNAPVTKLGSPIVSFRPPAEKHHVESSEG